MKLAIAVGAGREGGVHSHVRRGLGAGLTRDELRHVALLAITTIGWPAAVAALSWIEDAMNNTERSNFVRSDGYREQHRQF